MENSYVLGTIGIGKYNSYTHINIYGIWTSMFERCYSKNLHIKKPTYIGCSVDERWFNFQVFAEWYEQNYVTNYHLDKDILIKGNKIYGPDTCCFVPVEINNLFVTKLSMLGYPPGVSKSNSGFRVKINKFGVQTHIGVYTNITDAMIGYVNAKEQYIRESAEKFKNVIPQKLYECLINYKL